MKTLTIEEIEQVSGAGFCSGIIVTTFAGDGALLGAIGGPAGAFGGAELGVIAGAAVASAVCG